MLKEEFLNNLLNPDKNQEAFSLFNFSDEFCKNLLRNMLLIREAEKKLAFERKSGNIGGPVHLAAGQEAIPTGIAVHLTKSDYIFGAHRSHAHILSLGTSLKNFFAEILGRSTGLSKGYGGSMHLFDKSVGFMGSVPIVAGTISMAAGAGFAIRQKKSNSVAIAYLGDGAVEEGVFHETLNLASVNNLPVIFVIENNLFSSHMDILKRQPYSFTSRFAKANSIQHQLIDGNNIADVVKASGDLIENARKNKRPGLIEAITYRWFGHVDWREDLDVGTNRCKKSLENWKERCPIKRLKKSMFEDKILTSSQFAKIESEVIDKINNYWDLALKDPFPNENELLDNVFFGNK